MSDADLGFSMRMEGDDAVPTPPVDMFAVRPDRKGPKTVAILIIFGALLLAYQAYGDYLYHTAEDLSDSEVETLLITCLLYTSDAADE